MADMCEKCHRNIIDDHDKEIEEKNGELFIFHRECFDVEEFYREE